MAGLIPSPQMPLASQSPPMRFTVDAWSAWAPGLADAESWRAWARAPWRPAGDERPELPQYPMMLRRRAERLARMALQTVSEVRGAAPCPMVWASHRGETQRAVPLLRDLAESGAVAPGPFSLSVHNAVSALESIAHADTGNYTALAAAGESAELAIVEALALLTDGHEEVIVTVYDEIVPDCYCPYVDDADAPFAWSWRLRRAGADPGFELSWATGEGARDTGHGARESAALAEASDAVPGSREQYRPREENPVPRAPCPVPPDPVPRTVLPPALRVLAFFLSDAETLSHDGSHCRWTWRRTA